MTDFLLPFALFTMMLGLGMGTRFSDFVAIVRKPSALAAGVVSMTLVLPALGFMIARIAGVPGELAVGLVLVATCPGGVMSNYFSALLGADLPLSISLTSVVTVIYAFVVPLWATLAVGAFLAQSQNIQVSYVDAIVRLAVLILLPVSCGSAIAYRWPGLARRVQGYLRHLSALALISVYFWLLWTQRSSLVHAVSLTALPVVTLFALSCCSGYLIPRLFGLARRQRLAILVEHLMRQEGTAIYIGVTLVGIPAIALPLLLNTAYGLVFLMIMSTYIGLRGRPAEVAP